jgi:hypothetical protein
MPAREYHIATCGLVFDIHAVIWKIRAFEKCKEGRSMTSAYPGQREITFTNFDDILAGTLFLPEVERPKVALAMLQGSGATDRDNRPESGPYAEN